MLLIRVCEKGALGQSIVTLYNLPCASLIHCSCEVPFVGREIKPKQARILLMSLQVSGGYSLLIPELAAWFHQIHALGYRMQLSSA